MKRKTYFAQMISALLVLLCASPFLYILQRSFMDLSGSFSLHAYYQAFWGTSQYLLRFWKSMAMSICIAAGQTLCAVLAGFGFAKFQFPWKRTCFFALTVLMILPLQVTLIPNYMILSQLGMLGTYAALILPAIFAPLGTFLMVRTFRSVPDEILEASRLDGCNTMKMIAFVACPIGRNGVICTFLLAFLDSWNMVEQPIVYLQSFADFPLPVALASVPAQNTTVQLACCVMSAIPPLCLFALFNRELVAGIAVGGEK